MKKVVQYSKSIYSYPLILEAISAYKHICNIKVNKDDEYIICTFETARDATTIAREFGNYLIELMQ